MILDATNKTLEIVLAAAVAANQMPWTTSWIDRSGTTLTPGASDGTSNNTTAVTVLGAPASSTQRELQQFTIFNADTSGHTLTVRLVSGANTRVLVRFTLDVGDTLTWTKGYGWLILNSAGVPKIGGTSLGQSRWLRSFVDSANLTSTVTLTSGSSFFIYLGTCPVASSSISIRYRVTTAAATITWAEAGIFRGPIVLGGNPVLTRLGTTSISGVINTTGQKTTTVSLTTAAAAGDELWAVLANNATTVAVIRGTQADDLQSGVHAIQASYQPSTGASPNTMTLAGATAVLPWVTGYVN